MLLVYYKYKKLNNIVITYLFSSEFYYVYLFSAVLFRLQLELCNCSNR